MGSAAKKKLAPATKAGSEKDETKDEVVKEEEIENYDVPMVLHLCGWIIRLVALVAIGYSAYNIRLYAIIEYGRVIHEVQTFVFTRFSCTLPNSPVARSSIHGSTFAPPSTSRNMVGRNFSTGMTTCRGTLLDVL